MHQWLKRTVLVCGVFIAVWVGMAMYWNSQIRLPTPSDVVIYFGLAPLAMVLAIWFFTKLLVQLNVDSVTGMQDSGLQTNHDALDTSENRDAETGLIIVSSSIRAAHGQTLDELAEALNSNKARPALDEVLTDSNGYPILSGRVPIVDEQTQRETLSKWMETHHLPEIDWSEEQLRALAMGSATFLDLLQHVMAHPMLPAYTAATAPQSRLTALPTLQLHSILPLDWNEDHRHIATAWFKHLIEQQGWPSEQISVRQASPADADQPFLVIEQLSTQTHHQDWPCFALLIACESHIGEQSVLEWEHDGRLLTGSSETGQIPGEGAAGFLFADAEQAACMNVERSAKIHRLFQARREKSADAGGCLNVDLLSEIAEKALAAAVVPAEKIGFLAADTDHRASRVSELIGMVYKTFPDLDLKTQCSKVATACGSVGAVSSLTALALAHHASVTNASSAICISNQDAFKCSAIVVSPLPDRSSANAVPA